MQATLNLQYGKYARTCSPNRLSYDSASEEVPSTTFPDCKPHDSLSEAIQPSSHALVSFVNAPVRQSKTATATKCIPPCPDVQATLNLQYVKYTWTFSPNRIPYDRASEEVPPTTFPDCKPHDSLSEAIQPSCHASTCSINPPPPVEQDSCCQQITFPPVSTCRRSSTCKPSNAHEPLAPTGYHVTACPRKSHRLSFPTLRHVIACPRLSIVRPMCYLAQGA